MVRSNVLTRAINWLTAACRARRERADLNVRVEVGAYLVDLQGGHCFERKGCDGDMAREENRERGNGRPKLTGSVRPSCAIMR